MYGPSPKLSRTSLAVSRVVDGTILGNSNVTIGGPVRKDRLWFFTATRFSGTKIQVPGVYFTKIGVSTSMKPCSWKWLRV